MIAEAKEFTGEELAALIGDRTARGALAIGAVGGTPTANGQPFMPHECDRSDAARLTGLPSELGRTAPDAAKDFRMAGLASLPGMGGPAVAAPKNGLN